MERQMVRYSKLKTSKKDTLYTFRENDLIYFGISRCNFKAGDKFDKEFGKMVARNRALKAQELVKVGKETPANQIENVDFYAAYGCVHFSQVKNLIEYFRTLNTTFRASEQNTNQ